MEGGGREREKERGRRRCRRRERERKGARHAEGTKSNKREKQLQLCLFSLLSSPLPPSILSISLFFCHSAEGGRGRGRRRDSSQTLGIKQTHTPPRLRTSGCCVSEQQPSTTKKLVRRKKSGRPPPSGGLPKATSSAYVGDSTPLHSRT